MRIGYNDIDYHLENAEMTPELRDDLIHFHLRFFRTYLKKNTTLGGAAYTIFLLAF